MREYENDFRNRRLADRTCVCGFRCILKLAEARAMVARQYVARQYLAKNFKVDDARLKTLGAGENGQAPSGNVTIAVYSGSREDHLAVAKNK